MVKRMPPLPSDAALAARQQVAATLGLLLVFAGVIYSADYRTIVGIWMQSDTYAHGFLIVPICAWLIWRQREALDDAGVSPYWPAVGLLLVLSVGWALMERLDVQVGMHLAAVAVLPIAVLLVLGRERWRRIAFPMAFLFFAVPAGDFLVPVLIEFTATFTVAALNVTGIPVVRDAQFFSTSSGDFEVARACSGIRYLLASLTIGTLIAYLNFSTLWKRIAFIGFSLLFPIVANGIRAYLIVLIAHFSDMQLAVGVDHILFGWVFFSVVIAIMLVVASSFHEKGDNSDAKYESSGRNAGGTVRWRTAMIAVLAAAVALVIGPAAVTLAGQSASTTRASLPAEVPGWRGPSTILSSWYPLMQNASSQASGRYESAEGAVEAVVVTYSKSGDGDELTSAANRVIDDSDWRVTAPREVPIVVGAESWSVLEIRGSRGSNELLIWYWYDVGGHRVSSRLGVKTREAVALFRGTSLSSSLVAVSTSVDDDYESAVARVSEFLAAALSQFDTCRTNPVEAQCVQ